MLRRWTVLVVVAVAIGFLVSGVIVGIVGEPTDAIFLSSSAIALGVLAMVGEYRWGEVRVGPTGAAGEPGERGPAGPPGPQGMSGYSCSDRRNHI